MQNRGPEMLPRLPRYPSTSETGIAAKRSVLADPNFLLCEKRRCYIGKLKYAGGKR